MAVFIVWKDIYSVGDPMLDAQHKQIIDVINELYESKQNDSSQKAVKSIIDRLVEYTFFHFNFEEDMFQECDYPSPAEHIAVHDMIREKTLYFQKRADFVTDHELLQFLKEWWLDHIQGMDKQYAPYLHLAAARR
jgi:hemerythrin